MCRSNLFKVIKLVLFIIFIYWVLKMNMNMIEKIVVISSLVVTGTFCGYQFVKPNFSRKKEDVFKIRQQLLKEHDVRMLYSTMSFLYLQGFQQRNINSFYKMKDILKISPPQIVVLQLSEQQYNDKYSKVMTHPKFQQSIQRFEYFLQKKDTQSIQKMTQFDLENLEKLYLLRYCQKKNCQIVYGLQSNQFYEKLAENNKQLKLNNIQAKNIDEIKQDFYVQQTIKSFNSRKNKFLVLPASPFKTILGLVQPKYVSGIADKWKSKFKTAYGHKIIQDQQVLERQQSLLKAKQGGHY